MFLTGLLAGTGTAPSTQAAHAHLQLARADQCRLDPSQFALPLVGLSTTADPVGVLVGTSKVRLWGTVRPIASCTCGPRLAEGRAYPVADFPDPGLPASCAGSARSGLGPVGVDHICRGRAQVQQDGDDGPHDAKEIPGAVHPRKDDPAVEGDPLLARLGRAGPGLGDGCGQLSPARSMGPP